MKKYIIALILGFVIPNHTVAATVVVTAEFTPSVSNPSNNTFSNTTVNFGYCIRFPAQCEREGWHSLRLAIDSTPSQDILQNDPVSFKVPSAFRDVVVTNTSTGEKQTVKFALIGLGADIQGFGGNATGTNSQWTGGGTSWFYAPSGCTGTGLASGSNNSITWFWRWPNRNDTTTCTKTSTVNRGKYPNIRNANFMYSLTTPNPLSMADGVYTGLVEYRVDGSGAELNMGGPKYTVSDRYLYIRFELKVTHELSVKPVENGELSLHACLSNKICSASQSKVNWEKATVSGIPPILTAESNFTLTSSGSFTTYLRCEFSQGQDCGIRSSKTGHTVPVKALLTLPDAVNNKGSLIRNLRIKNVKDTGYAFFTTDGYVTNGKGKLHFEVGKQDVADMQKNAPDDYSGIITVIFDPQVW